MMYKHSCIKKSCGSAYEDDDPDNYYCPSCQKENKKIAARIDAELKVGTRKPAVSELQRFEQTAIKRVVDGRTIMFGRG